MPIQQLYPEYQRRPIETTWVNRPIENEGAEVLISDFGSNIWKVVGGKWLPKSSLRPRIIYSDNFKRPDTALGSIGAGWVLQGNGVSQTKVSAGKYVLPQTDPVNVRTVYACRNLPFQPTYLAVRFNWKSNGGSSGLQRTVALIMPKSAALGILPESIHITMASQIYTQVLTAGGAFVNIAPLFTPPATAAAVDGTQHFLEVYVFGSLVISVIDGVISGYADSPEYVLPVTPTNQIMVEHYSPSGQDIQYELEVNEIMAGYAW